MLKKISCDKWTLFTFSLFILAITITAFTISDYGISWDDPVHHYYGTLVAKWYLEFFNDKAAVNFSNLKLYGALFDIWSGFFESFFGSSYVYKLRKILMVFFGLFGVFATVRLTIFLTKSSRAGFFVAILLFINPVFYGHMFINPKDIPFAAGYVLSVYYLTRIIDALPSCSTKLSIKLGLAMGLALGIRAGGFVLYAYTLMSVGSMLFYYIWKKKITFFSALKNGSTIVLIAFFFSYGIMLIFWPWAQVKPFQHPFEALTLMTKFPNYISIVFDGETISAQSVPKNYIPKLMLIQNIEISIILIFVGIIASISLMFKANSKQIMTGILIAVAGFFPILYVAIKKSALYDNYRHLLFCIPILMVIAAFALEQLVSYCQRFRSKIVMSIFYALLALTFLHPVIIMIKLHPNEYAYYNCFIGGPKDAYKRYENDYWGISVLELLKILEQKIKQEYPNTAFKISSNPMMPSKQIREYAKNSPQLQYTRSSSTADFMVSLTRWNQHHKIKGQTFVSVGRFGQTFSVVKDLRQITEGSGNFSKHP